MTRLSYRLVLRCAFFGLSALVSLPSIARAEAPSPGPAAEVKADIRGSRGSFEMRPNPFHGELLDANDVRGWQPVCPLPCRRSLDPTLEYRAVGSPFARYDRTDAFTLPRGSSDLRINVDLRSNSARQTGFAFTVIGAGLIPGGVVFAGVAGMGDPGLASNAERTVTRVLVIGGFASAGLGVVMLLTGVPLLLANRTRVTVDGPQGPRLRLVSGLTLTPRGLVF